MKKRPPTPKRSRNKAPVVAVPEPPALRTFTINFVHPHLAPITVTGDGLCFEDCFVNVLKGGKVVAVIPSVTFGYVTSEEPPEVPPPAVPEQTQNQYTQEGSNLQPSVP